MVKHKKLPEISVLIKEGFTVLIHGERGSGKTTLVRQVAEDLDLKFFVLSMTRQTTLSHLMGFMNVNGIYVPSLLRKAVENGGVFLLDELDAADPNVILALNTLENGFVSFPDEIVKVHEDFRLVATANPFGAHSEYTGRAVLDAATLDRFDKVELDRDSTLESSLISNTTFEEIQRIRKVISDQNVGIHISMRDAIRLDKRKNLGLDENYIQHVLFQNTYGLFQQYLEATPEVREFQQNIKSIDALWASIIK